jgi:hypothetical protein
MGVEYAILLRPAEFRRKSHSAHWNSAGINKPCPTWYEPERVLYFQIVQLHILFETASVVTVFFPTKEPGVTRVRYTRHFKYPCAKRGNNWTLTSGKYWALFDMSILLGTQRSRKFPAKVGTKTGAASISKLC